MNDSHPGFREAKTLAPQAPFRSNAVVSVVLQNPVNLEPGAPSSWGFEPRQLNGMAPSAPGFSLRENLKVKR